jgi:hypothetical protein
MFFTSWWWLLGIFAAGAVCGFGVCCLTIFALRAW